MDPVGVGIGLRGHQQQHRARDHHAARRPAEDRKELAGVVQRVAVILGRDHVPLFPALDKVPEQQQRRHDQHRHQKVEDAALVQPGLVEGELILQPAEEHAEGARAGHIAADFQRFFIHKPYLDSIRCLCINWELYDYIPIYTISQGKRYK